MSSEKGGVYSFNNHTRRHIN